MSKEEIERQIKICEDAEEALKAWWGELTLESNEALRLSEIVFSKKSKPYTASR